MEWNDTEPLVRDSYAHLTGFFIDVANVKLAKYWFIFIVGLFKLFQTFNFNFRSSDGMETMKLFVLANSIVMLTTIAYPHIQTIFSIISEMIYGIDELY